MSDTTSFYYFILEDEITRDNVSICLPASNSGITFINLRTRRRRTTERNGGRRDGNIE